MSAPDLILPGFYGKMPATGDFVARRLPTDFVRGWDRWLAQNIVPLFGLEAWPRNLALRFLAGPAFVGPSAGVILQCSDRIGRQFPLIVAAQFSAAPLELARADAWFGSIEAAAYAAQRGALTPDELNMALAALPAPFPSEDGDLIDDLVIWTAHSDIFDVDPQAPRETMVQIFVSTREASRCSRNRDIE